MTLLLGVVRIKAKAKAAALELTEAIACSFELAAATSCDEHSCKWQHAQKGRLYRDVICLRSALLVYMFLSPFLCLWQASRKKSEAGGKTAALQPATAMLHAVLPVQK